MHFDVPDPRYTASAHSRDWLRLAVRLSIGFVALLWLIHLMNWGLDLDPWPFGLQPRQWSGLVGILTAPLVHSDFAHLFANSVPLATVGAAMLFLYPRSALRVLPAVYLGSGLAVWLFGRGAVHLGASGLVYGLVSYVLIAGLLRSDRRAIAASLLVILMYGSLVWGVLPIEPGVSWETHLSAAVIGALFAFALRRLDVPPRKRYAWEDEAAEPDVTVQDVGGDVDGGIEERVDETRDERAAVLDADAQTRSGEPPARRALPAGIGTRA
jgi:membrane associated rhomboid family serine protease